MLEEIIAIVAVVLVIGGAVAYIIKAKKSGRKCIGCPDSGSCHKNKGKCDGNCCHCQKADNENE